MVTWIALREERLYWLRPLSQVEHAGMVASGHTKGGSNAASGLMIFWQWLGCMIACFKLDAAPSNDANNFERLMKGHVQRNLL